jgi:flagellar hook-length control protein FliK
MPAAAATPMTGGSRKAMQVTAERSESWQQDMVQAIMPAMSCPQSM